MNGTLHNRDALQVASEMAPASVRLVYCDGPYGLDFGEWDKAKGADLVDWYAPHFDAFDRLAMPSASLVVWGRSESWAWLHCDLVRRGWRFCGSVVWDKGNATTAMRADPDTLRSWPQTHEVCGIYQRDELEAPTCAATTVAYAAGSSDRNWIRVWLGEQWKAAGLRRAQANEAMGTATMAGHYFSAAQWALPTWEAYQTLAAYAAEHGREPDGLPWLVHPDAPDLRTTYEHLRAEFEHLRAPFDLGSIIGSVWRESPPTLAASRHGHPCEKPPGLTRRLVEVLTRPGELVFEPFGGSSPVARCCESMPRDLARCWVSCETDAKHVERTRAMLSRTQGALL